MASDPYSSLRQHLANLFEQAEAHADARSTLKEFPRALQGKKPPSAPHTPWEMLEHMRIAQWDILKFSVDPKHVSPKFPDGYWPKESAPKSDAAWDQSAKQFLADLGAMKKLVTDPKTDLFANIPHGEGQTILREALLVADHNAYHLGQLILVRRILEGK